MLLTEAPMSRKRSRSPGLPRRPACSVPLGKCEARDRESADVPDGPDLSLNLLGTRVMLHSQVYEFNDASPTTEAESPSAPTEAREALSDLDMLVILIGVGWFFP